MSNVRMTFKCQKWHLFQNYECCALWDAKNRSEYAMMSVVCDVGTTYVFDRAACCQGRPWSSRHVGRCTEVPRNISCFLWILHNKVMKYCYKISMCYICVSLKMSVLNLCHSCVFLCTSTVRGLTTRPFFSSLFLSIVFIYFNCLFNIFCLWNIVLFWHTLFIFQMFLPFLIYNLMCFMYMF